MSPDRIEAISRRLADPSSRRSVLSLFGVGVAGTAVTAFGLNETLGQGNGNGGENPFEDIVVTGVNQAGDEVFNGALDIKRFVASGGQIYALGRLTGTVEKNGRDRRVRRGVRLPVELAASGLPGEGDVSAQQVACGILDLTLGPLDLNLLGLRIQLSQIDLQITAIPGGGLLGDLLCAIAELLDPLGSLRQLVRLLNRLLDFFN
jgi:hypothetical protein